MGIIFYAVGPLLLLAGIFAFIKRKKFAKESTVINGVIKEMQTGPASRNKTAYYPVFGYFDEAAAKDETYISNSACDPSKLKVGDKVELRYLSDGNKKQICLNNWAGIWGFAFMLTLFGLIFSVIAVLLLLFAGSK